MPKKQIPLIYQEIIDNIDYSQLPYHWRELELSKFSKGKNLYDYQEDALKSIVKFLYKYYELTKSYRSDETEKDNLERKKELYSELKDYDKYVSNLYISDKKNKLLFNKLKEYYDIEYLKDSEIIPFYNFVNRSSYWMATGSGKSLIIIKLVEILNNYIELNLIPNNDIVILTHKDELINQIKEHIKQYNELHFNKQIKLWSLKDYNDVKQGKKLVNNDEINIFIYRSDLISNEEKEKLINFEDIENNGKWYVILDEAHRGDKEDSKRQLYYSIMSRNGLLFNFSASFTDDWDLITTTYNFNLSQFINSGYGKQIYMSEQNLEIFSKKSQDYTGDEKKKIILKTLILLTYLKKIKKSIDEKVEDLKLYHNPLLVSLVNSVNTKDSDLELFFRALEEIGNGNISNTLFTEAKEELYKDIYNNPQYIIGNGEITLIKDEFISIQFKDVLYYVFNAESSGSIDVIKVPQNREELVFKLKTSNEPFALIKIGDITKWLKEKLTNYNILEKYDDESYFETLNEENSEINILMGSRAFYEGWDSNRPNIMLYINIGKGDAKKYVIQSVGRGVRIEPLNGKRKRLKELSITDKFVREIYSKLKDHNYQCLETLFLYGTNKENIKKILEGISYEKNIIGENIALKKNDKKIEEFGGEIELLVPTYKEVNKQIDIENLPTFDGNKERIKKFVDWTGSDEMLYCYLSANYYDVDVKTVKRLKEYLEKGKFSGNDKYPVKYQLRQLLSHMQVVPKELSGFESIEGKIIHFKRINIKLDDEEIDELKNRINSVASYVSSEDIEKTLVKQLENREISAVEFAKKLKKLSSDSPNEREFKDLKIKYLSEHYYIPAITTTKDKVEYINHIIKEESEREFINELEKYILNESNLLKNNMWMFSKIDEGLDTNVYIPYYDPESNKIRKFHPDFILWIKKEDKYHIIFIDPKGIKHTDYEHKIEGYKSIFEEDRQLKEFNVNGKNIRVHLYMYNKKNADNVSSAYKKYWINNFKFLERVLEEDSSL